MRNKNNFFKIAGEIDNIFLLGLNEVNKKGLFSIIEKEGAYENYFWRKIVSLEAGKFLKWFLPLKEKDFFSPDKAPVPQETDQKGHYRIPEWNVLPYLERVSEQVTISGNEKYIREVLEIIRNVSNYKNAEDKHIDNYRIWWYFVKILLNIPNDRITVDTIDLMRIWLKSRFDTSLPGSEIATKLLPKLLDSNNPNDWKKVERIIEIITDLDLDKKEPQTVLDTYWLLESLRKNADKIAKKCSEKVIFNLADNLKEIFRKKYGLAHPIIEFRGTTFQMTIEQTEDFDYSVGIALEKEILEKVPTWKSWKGFELKECRDKKTFVEGVKQGLLQYSDFKDLKDELNEDLEFIYEKPLDASFIWFRNLFSDPELGIHGTEETLTAILRDITLAKARRNKEVTLKKIFSKFFGSEYRYPIFRRIALFVIGKEWSTYKDYLWRLMETEEGEKLFTGAVFEPELYTLLERNVSVFNDEKKEKIKIIIEKGPQKERYNEKQIIYWKQKWYSAVKADSYFMILYKEQKKLTQIEEGIFFKEPEVKVGPGPSPLLKEDIWEMSNLDLAKQLIKFRTKDRWRGPTVGGLSEVLKSAVQEKPEKFIEELNPFLGVGYLYIYVILWGIRDAWTNKKLIDWEKFFKFFKQYIERDDFWQDKFKIEGDDWNADHQWVIGMIGEVIQEGTKDDGWAFSEEHFETAKEIIFLILDNLKFKKSEEKEGAVIYALNSAPGKVITALIYLALRIARVEAKKGIKKEIKWSIDIREKYEKVLKDEVIEAYTLLGQYMGNLLYVDKVWLTEKIQSISPSEIDLWEAFMEGYLWASKVHEYELMRVHVFKAIDHEFKEKQMEEKLVQYICIGYLRGKEDLLGESLFGKLLKKWKASQIEIIIRFFWAHNEPLFRQDNEKKNKSGILNKEGVIKRIIDFWRWVYKNHYESRAPEDICDDDKVILSNLSILAVYLPQIDSQNFEWLKLSARYVETRSNSNFFIEYLDRLKDEQCYVGEIFLKMLNNFIPYPFPKLKSHIQSIVEHLYKIGINNCKKAADEICNIYGENEFDFLRNLYEQNNPSV